MDRRINCVIPIYRDEFFRNKMNSSSRILGILGNLGFNLNNIGTYYFSEEILSLVNDLKQLRLQVGSTFSEQVYECIYCKKSFIHEDTIDRAFDDSLAHDKDISTYLVVFGDRIVRSKEEYRARIANEVFKEEKCREKFMCK